MKLCLISFQICKDCSLDEMIRLARTAGFSGLEFRIEAGHAHGVELELSPSQRRAVRYRLEDSYLTAACLGTGDRYDHKDPTERRKVIDHTKRVIELARDIDCGRIRVFGNDIPEGVEREDCVKYVGEALRELGEFAADFGVDVLLEMHGQFNFWRYARSAVETAAHPRVGLNYNCDMRDVVGGSIRDTYLNVREYVRHVHLHDLTDGFPYDELFSYLIRDGFEGFLSPEIESSNDPERVLKLYAAFVREKWLRLGLAQP